MSSKPSSRPLNKRRCAPSPPSKSDRILALAQNFPRLWSAPTTTARDRKRILRLLVRDITVTRGPEPKIVRLHVRLARGRNGSPATPATPEPDEADRYPEAFVARIRELSIDHPDGEIVALLRAEGHRSATGKPFTVGAIRWIRYKHRISAPEPPAGSLSVRQVGERYGVSLWVVHYWIAHGIISPVRSRPKGPYAITIDAALDHCLRTWIANPGHLRPASPTLTA